MSTPKRFRCGECGWLVTPVEFHPLEYCQNVKEGFSPRARRPAPIATKSAAAWLRQKAAAG